MRGPLRSILLVMRYELADGLRSRRAAVVLLLYIAAAVLTMNATISGLLRLEKELASVLQLDVGDRAGAVTDALWKSERFRRIVGELVRDPALVRDLFGTPPIVLIYGGLAFFYTPLLVMLVTSGRIAEELASGSARYVLYRTSRLSWVTGKWLGQAAMIGIALLMGAAGAWCLARLRMVAGDAAATSFGVLLWAGRAWLYSLAYVGLALGVSLLVRSPGKATALALLVWFALMVLSWASTHYYGEGIRQLWHLGTLLAPHAHRFDLWRSQAALVIPSAVHLTALSFCYLYAGYAWFRMRDT